MNKQVAEWNKSEFSPWDQGFQMFTERLYIPAAILHMPNRCIPRDCSQTKQEICLIRDALPKGRSYTLRIHSISLDGCNRLYLIPLTGLDEEEFRLASQSRTLLGCEVRYNVPDGNEDFIRRVDSSKFAMGQDTEHEAVCMLMVWVALLLLQQCV